MTKAVIRFKDDSFINIIADTIEFEKGIVYVKNRDKLVAVTKVKEIVSCHLSEKVKE